MSLPSWDDVDAGMRTLAASATASECHGVLCGLLCMGEPEARSAWLEHVVGTSLASEPLDTLYEETLRQLDDAVFEFELLLPGDDTDIAERTAAIADWCGGFAFGVGASRRGERALPEDTAEFLADVTEIARAGENDAIAVEEEEDAYMEVVEYLRVGTLLARTECAGG